MITILNMKGVKQCDDYKYNQLEEALTDIDHNGYEVANIRYAKSIDTLVIKIRNKTPED